MNAEEFREGLGLIGDEFIARAKTSAAEYKTDVCALTARLDGSGIAEIYITAIMTEFAMKMAKGAKEIEAELQ